MTDSIRVFDPGFRVTDTNGNPVSGATITFYDAGTTDLRTVYSDSGLSTSLGSTVTCNSAGAPAASGAEVLIYTGTTAYKVEIKDAASVTLHTFDNVRGATDTSTFAQNTATPVRSVSAQSSDYTITSADQGELTAADPTSADVTLTLPSAVTVGDGWLVGTKHVGSGNNVIVESVSLQSIDASTGGTQYILTLPYQSATFVSDGADWHVLESHSPIWPITPQGYLTLASGTPFMTANAAGATTVYYTPDAGAHIPIWDGFRWNIHEFSELSLTLNASAHLASTVYDIFVINDNGTLRLVTGPAWANSADGSGSRGAGAGTAQIGRKNGLYTNQPSGTTTMRNGSTTYSVGQQEGTYVGTLKIDGTAGQVSCYRTWGQSRTFHLWNAYNQRDIIIQVGDTTSNWTYSSATIRPSRADGNNSIVIVTGLNDTIIEARFAQRVGTAASETVRIGIGWNSTTAFSGKVARLSGGTNEATIEATYINFNAQIGSNKVNSLEAAAAGTVEFFGGSVNDMLLTVQYRG